jgi:hypothetical protein
MAYIRKTRVKYKKTGKVYIYNQVVRTRWDKEKKRSVPEVLAHLGKHETVEDALSEAQEKRDKLANYMEEDRKMAEEAKEKIREEFGAQLEKHHGGEIPRAEEISLRMIMSETPNPYMSDFGKAERHHLPWNGKPYTIYRGYDWFGESVKYMRTCEDHSTLYVEEVEKLDERIAKLEAVEKPNPQFSRR